MLGVQNTCRQTVKGTCTSSKGPSMRMSMNHPPVRKSICRKHVCCFRKFAYSLQGLIPKMSKASEMASRIHATVQGLWSCTHVPVLSNLLRNAAVGNIMYWQRPWFKDIHSGIDTLGTEASRSKGHHGTPCVAKIGL